MGVGGRAECLHDEGGDGPHTVGEDHCADDGDEDGEDALRMRDGQDVPVAHRAARAGSCDELQQFVDEENILCFTPEDVSLPKPLPSCPFCHSAIRLISLCYFLIPLHGCKLAKSPPYRDYRPVQSNHVAD